jgi:hypothetical protein
MRSNNRQEHHFTHLDRLYSLPLSALLLRLSWHSQVDSVRVAWLLEGTPE